MAEAVHYDARRLERLEVSLRRALPHWGLSQRTDLRLLTVSENATFRARDPDTGLDLVFRVHRPGYHTKAEIASELTWLEALARDDVVPVARAIRQSDGELIAEIDDEGRIRRAVAFGALPGREPAEDPDLPAWFRKLGAITARLQAHARSWRRPPGFVRKVWDFDAMLGKAPLWGDWRAALGLDADGLMLLERTAALLRRLLDTYGTGEDRFGLVHADLRLANLLAHGDTLSVVDFDDCGFSWYLYDFAAAISFSEHKPHVALLQQAWIEGHRTVAALPPEDCTFIPVFIMLRRLLLTAWIASHVGSPTAEAMGEAYTHGTVALACEFLARYAPHGARLRS